jgi:C4-dicarboxylate transporter DctM subunit
MIVYGIATETSIGRLFLAGVIPGLLLVGLFMAWSLYDTWRKGSMDALAGALHLERALPHPAAGAALHRHHSRRALRHVRRLCHAVGNGGRGRAVLPVVAIIIYKLWSPTLLWHVLRDSTRESVMILFIIAAAGVFSYMLSSLFITQSIAAWIGTLDVNPGC